MTHFRASDIGVCQEMKVDEIFRHSLSGEIDFLGLVKSWKLKTIIIECEQCEYVHTCPVGRGCGADKSDAAKQRAADSRTRITPEEIADRR